MSERDYSPGDIVWAKLDGHPWWPGLVCNGDEETHKKANKQGELIHVQFFDKISSHAWIRIKNVKPFEGRSVPEFKPGGIFHSNKKTLWEAVSKAEKTEFMTIKERLKLVIKEMGKSDASKSGTDSGTDHDEEEKPPITIKKRRLSPEISKPNKKRKIDPSEMSGTFIIGVTKIPEHWETPYVLMNTKDVPDGLKPGDVFNLKGKVSTQPQPQIKLEVPEETEDDINDLDSEDEIDDSDEDPGWTPEMEHSEPEAEADEPEDTKPDLNHDDSEDDDADLGGYDDDDDDDEDYDDEHDDPGWGPKKRKKAISSKKKPVKFGLISKSSSSSTPQLGSKPVMGPKSSLKHSDPVDAAQKSLPLNKIMPAQPAKKTSPNKGKNMPSQPAKTSPNKSETMPSQPAKTSPNKGETMPAQPAKTTTTAVSNDSGGLDNPRNIIITDNTPTGPEPDVGDFVLEKAECKNGNIPFIWRYKRGGLIQKYERIEEDGKVYYQNVLSFSDWWACFAHKYQKVKTQIMFKYKNMEKVQILEQPEIEVVEPTPDQTQNQTTTTSNTTTTSSSSTTTTTSSSSSTDSQPQTTVRAPSSERMQEQEISSTTSEPLPDMAFQIGQFVLDMKDKRNVDNFPIWKIESQILLKKYEPVIKTGRLLHKPVKTYRGYREISKHYIPIEVKRRLEIPGEEHVEVTEETKPKISLDQNMEEEYEKSPLLRHFYVYMQVFLSQALEPGFLDEVRKTKDPTYMFPLGEIDKIIDQKKTNVERKVKWTDKIKDALKRCPYLREVNKPGDKKKCEAVVESEEQVEESVFLFGSDYNLDTLKQSGTSHPCQEFKIGKTAIKYITTYHQLCHFRYNLYDKCLAKIKLIRDSQEGVEVEKIMDECLGNKGWVLQNFEDFMTLVEIV